MRSIPLRPSEKAFIAISERFREPIETRILYFTSINSQKTTSMSNYIAIAAVLVAILAFCVQYISLIERRHAEIIQHKNRITDALSSQRHRCVSLLTNIEILRMEVRRIPDCEDKFMAIEAIPSWIRALKEIISIIDDRMKTMDDMDSMKMNRTGILLILQRLAGDTEQSELRQRELEGALLAQLGLFRKDIENVRSN